MTPDAAETSFPRLSARTRKFRLGVPRSFVVAPGHDRVLFLRSASGTDPVHSLWQLDLATGAETLIADGAQLLSVDGAEELTPQERARRERMRETASGIVGFATDRAARIVAFALSGRVQVVEVGSPDGVRALPAAAGAVDPRPDPTGRWVAYAAGGALRVAAVDGSADRAVVEPDGPEVAWGLAEFAAAEELDRSRGAWWAPDGRALIVERYDEAPVQTWWVADPANPERPAAAMRYPVAGGANADVSLWLVDLEGTRTQVRWDREAFEYVSDVRWEDGGPPVVRVLSRDQRRAQVLAVDPTDGSTRLLADEHDDAWLEVVDGVPARLPDGRLLGCVDRGGTRHLALDGQPVTPDGVQLDAVVGVDATGVLAVVAPDPVRRDVVRVGPDGALEVVAGGGGMHAAAGTPSCAVVTSRGLDDEVPAVRVVRPGRPDVPVGVRAVPAPFLPRVALLRAGPREVRTALLLPRDHRPGTRLPVLLDPYGGPGGPRVLESAGIFLEPQWLADQGFAVVVADGRGTPARGPAWERAIREDISGAVLEDQVEALHAAAAACPDLDLERVGIRGWSFGGYLAAMAVLRRPDVFHAAVAGAPVTDWRLYDTAYTERYLGDPAERPEAYERSSLIPDAPKLRRPLLLVHGLADDNVVVAHTLRLSRALLEAGRPHHVLPLSGVTHMTPQEQVAENLLLVQVEFLREALGGPRA